MKELTITVGGGFLGKDLEFLESPLTLVLHEGTIESIEKGGSGSIDLRTHIIMPPLSNMHVHILDCLIPEEGWDLDIDSVVGEPYGLKYTLLRKRLEECSGIISAFIREARTSGVGFIAEFREFDINGLLIDHDRRKKHHYVLAMPSRILKRKLTVNYLKKMLELSNGVGISSPLYFDTDELKTIFRTARESGKAVFSHVSETQETWSEHDFRKLMEAGSPDAVVHGVWLTEEEIYELKEKKVTLVLCPRSNLWFLSGIPNLYVIYESGVDVALGTDNCGWIKPDLWREAEILYLLSRNKKVNDPSWILKSLVNASPVGVENFIEEGKEANVLFLRYAGTVLEKARNKHVALIKRGDKELIGGLVLNGEAAYCGEYPAEKALCNSLRDYVS
ncbi:MAG: hypothetical protein DRO10_02740 [Thermoprotei archaeon]|nr:MAG: hypothetical protein DRO10_02740 [Thermoprotei archaeon]